MIKANFTGLISSVPFESRLLLGALGRSRGLSDDITTGRLGAERVVHITSGMGAANAAWAATVLLERFSPARIVLFGIGGAYPGSGLRVGNVALAETEVYADTGVLLAGGFRGTGEMGIELLKKGRRKYHNEFPLDRPLLKRALKCIDGARSGIFATVSAATGTTTRARALRRRFGAICENMEGAAVAHVCARYGTPALELRGISNMVVDRDPSGWDKDTAAGNSQEAVLKLLGCIQGPAAQAR